MLPEQNQGWKRRGLVPGRRYTIHVEDCCVEGDLVGTFLGLGEEENGEFFCAVFDFGTLDWSGAVWRIWSPTVDVTPNQ